MNYRDLKSRLMLSEEEFELFRLKFNLDKDEEIDAELVNYIEDVITRKRKYKNESSLMGIRIEGLFNKFNYDINFNNVFNIFVAENGHGKTTIIKILVAALKNDRKSLQNLPFSKVHLTFSNGEVTTLSKHDYINKFKEYKNVHFDSSNDKKDDEYLKKWLDYYLKLNNKKNIEHKSTFTIQSRNSNNENSNKTIIFKNGMGKDINRSVFNGHTLLKEEVKYLPTFRRVEAELSDLLQNETEFESNFNKSELKFGLKDVESRILEITSRLTTEAFETHSKINGEILGDLLSDSSLTINSEQRKEITIEKINIITGRIGESNIKEYKKLTDFILNLNNDHYQHQNRDFLEYYLYQLIKIHNGQREIDNKIKAFRDVCNKYLINKRIFFDEIIPSLVIVDRDDEKVISFSELSSGEKQILSIFSELYLEEKRNLIYIIDEPELSLSIAWQKEILMDIYSSGSVALLIATTHSPFIFKNDLESYANDLNSYKSKYDSGNDEISIYE
ncbi:MULTISPECIES: AAA family ATPase [unclassified Exiguobacterium]|uniref:AAA family ATPase n=1 Tax=unclassified Exiguobacterium TaxID=2644629 RepID=UPI001BE841C2|nr:MULTISPECIES: AAA family ATPase [unclassified Exiguobacterium]